MKKLSSLLLTVLLLLSLAACGNAAPTGGAAVPAADPAAPAEEPAAPAGPVGTWTLSASGDPAYAPGQIRLVLDEAGGGYRAVTNLDSSYVYQDYLELRWSEGAIVLDGAAGAFLLQGDSLTFTWNGVTDTYVRSGGVDNPTPVAPGSYTGTRFFEEGEEFTSEDPFALTVAADGTGTWLSYGEALPMTWDSYFFTVDGEQSFFYVYDGSTLTIYDGEYTMILEPGA